MADGDNVLIRKAKVESVEDEFGGDRIKVCLIPADNNKLQLDKNSEYFSPFYAMPLLPKMFYVKPKVGECVYIINAVSNNLNSERYYIGPIVSQMSHMDEERYEDSMAFDYGAYRTADANPNLPKKSNGEKNHPKGVYPDKEDISIEGRKNCGVQIKDNEIRVKAGLKKTNPSDRKEITFNQKDPAYMQLKYFEQNDNSKDKFKSTATIVADKINLIGNEGDGNFKVYDDEELISKDSMNEIIAKAHQLPYGDVLIEFLDLFRKAFINHTHKFPTFTPTVSGDIENLTSYNLKKNILSDSVRIN